MVLKRDKEVGFHKDEILDQVAKRDGELGILALADGKQICLHGTVIVANLISTSLVYMWRPILQRLELDFHFQQLS